MFIFQYNGLRDKLLMQGISYNTKLIQAGLDSVVNVSKDYIGQNVVVIFDNTHDERSKSAIRGDLVNSTFRQGILKDITRPQKAKDSLVLFEDPDDGKKILTPVQTIALIDIVSTYDLAYPVQIENPELAQFFFKFFYHRRGETGLLHSNPLGAFIDGRSKVIRPGNECKQAYFKGFQSLSAKIEFDDDTPERCTGSYEKMLREGKIASKNTYVIRCGKRGQ